MSAIAGKADIISALQQCPLMKSGHRPLFSLPSRIGGAWVPNLQRETFLPCGVSIQRCPQNAPGRGGKLFSRCWRAFSCAISSAVVTLSRRRYSASYRRRYSALYRCRYSAPSALACFVIFSTVLRYDVTVMAASIAFTSEKIALCKSHLCEAHHRPGGLNFLPPMPLHRLPD